MTYHFSIYDLFQLPLSLIAHEELQQLQGELNDMSPSNDHDTWKLEGNSAILSTKKVYILLIGQHDTPDAILDIWKTEDLHSA
jgi:hypothetical protein